MKKRIIDDRDFGPATGKIYARGGMIYMTVKASEPSVKIKIACGADDPVVEDFSYQLQADILFNSLLNALLNKGDVSS